MEKFNFNPETDTRVSISLKEFAILVSAATSLITETSRKELFGDLQSSNPNINKFANHLAVKKSEQVINDLFPESFEFINRPEVKKAINEIMMKLVDETISKAIKNQADGKDKI